MAYKSKLDSWLSAALEAGWQAALVVAPLFFNVFSSRVFEPDKISLIRTIALVMILAWLVKLANGGGAWLPAYREQDAGDAPDASDSQPSHATRFWRVPLLLPILLLVAAYLISTLFSVARFVSWWGSYQRLQGTYTFLSYVIIALLAAGHLRTPAQIRRLQHAIILSSLPIAIYGIVQHYGIDPLPWGGDVQTRVAANAGNAIFLAAYLIMAFFFTLERVYSSFAFLLGYKPDDGADAQDMPTAIAGGAYLFVLMVQGLAIYWTQSRGPWLGLFLGLYLFVLLLFSALRPARHRLWTGLWVSLGAAGVILLIAANTLPIFAGLRDAPGVGRLTTLLESDSGTGRVRVLIWQGTAEMVQPHEPLIFPDGSQDLINAIRPLVGYGPEAMWIAYNPFYPPELAHVEARNASPDRAHNETWDSLVITGLFGFLAYLALFVAIFYWTLRWLGLLINRRDNWLFGGLLAAGGLIFVLAFYWYDQSWRFFGVALPAGLMLGLGGYVTLAAFLHPHFRPDRRDLPRKLLLITLLATFAAHFTEIHFGIAIAATRTYFWIQTALLLTLGMGWAATGPFAVAQLPDDEPAADNPPPTTGRAGRRRSRNVRATAADRSGSSLPALPATVMTDLLIFLTLVFVYTTNPRGADAAAGVLFNAVTERAVDGQVVGSPAILFLLFFTWLIAAGVGLAAEALQQNRSPGIGWWLRGTALHALIVWGGWLIYGLIHGARMVPGAGGSDLDGQLAQVAGHFALYTWLVVGWALVAAVVYAWPWLRERRLPAVRNLPLSLGAGALLAVLMVVAVNSVNIALVRADIIYKQGQQFDSQGNWPSSVELYRRALAARRTEDHYMLFLGRALLEQAKQAPADGTARLPGSPTLDDVLTLTPEAVSQMGRADLLNAAEVVLKEAQRVNPLNTDHTANLARLYRTWADLVPEDPSVRQEMLDSSIAAYNMAVHLSPNAAHLWNEKGNAHLARNEPEQAEAAYLQSLSLDAAYDQTYLLLADFYERNQQYEKAIDLLAQGVDQVRNYAPLYSFLSVAYARSGDLESAVDANLKVLEAQPANNGAMRNLALLYRDLGDTDQAIQWAENSIAATNPANANEIKALRQLAAQIYQTTGRLDQAIGQYEAIHTLDPQDTAALNVLANLYISKQDLNKAVETLRALSEMEPNNYEHPFAIAQILQQAGRFEEALRYAEQAQALTPDDQKQAVEQFIALLKGDG